MYRIRKRKTLIAYLIDKREGRYEWRKVEERETRAQVLGEGRLRRGRR